MDVLWVTLSIFDHENCMRWTRFINQKVWRECEFKFFSFVINDAFYENWICHSNAKRLSFLSECTSSYSFKCTTFVLLLDFSYCLLTVRPSMLVVSQGSMGRSGSGKEILFVSWFIGQLQIDCIILHFIRSPVRNKILCKEWK